MLYLRNIRDILAPDSVSRITFLRQPFSLSETGSLGGYKGADSAG
jgi:hypothetical protein